jgi:hypothetical protein
MNVEDPYQIVEEVEQSMQWFCDKVVEPYPLEKKSKERILQRMINLGWLRKSEYELYIELTNVDDESQ